MSDDLARQMRANSERWFPQMHDGTFDLRTFYALGLAGEAGEVANVVKKGLRSGTLDLADLGAELADVWTYLLLLADECGIDLEAEYRAKVIVNEARWGREADSEPPAEPPCEVCGGTGLVVEGDGDYEGAGCHEVPCPRGCREGR